MRKSFTSIEEEDTVDPNEIVPRQGPPSIDYKISDKKVNQICIALLGHIINDSTD
jgi:hypothetical protein